MVFFTPGNTSQSADQILLAHPCHKQKTQENLGRAPLVTSRIGMESQIPTIEWLATTSRTQRFLKKDKFQVDSHFVYLDWLKTVVNNGKSEVNLTLTMPNPSDTIKQAAKEDLLAAHAAHQQVMWSLYRQGGSCRSQQ
ncbi:hypothetical protein VP01_3707g2 [Puccinia sorghi]|uniref:Uncharacterized protein n=1 Tax=Puccinia sorghi TaxID=27349 RepID=A0A0L6UUX9_9BASI|nr:hypothetical protein VP01_3707g2 [Puccinia sorghi]